MLDNTILECTLEENSSSRSYQYNLNEVNRLTQIMAAYPAQKIYSIDMVVK